MTQIRRKFARGLRTATLCAPVLLVAAILRWGYVPAAATPPGGRGAALPELEIGRTAQYDYDPPEPGTYRLPVIKPAGDGDVLTPDGKKTKLRDVLEGRITILSFVYTRCADPTACPAATGALFQVKDVSEKDRSIAENLRLVTFSFDPAHDTPKVMAEYARGIGSAGGGSEWLFLTTSGTRQLEPILDAYGQRVDRKKNAGDPYGPFYHVVRVYLIDRDAMIRNIYSFGMLDPRMVLADVRTLMLESESPTASGSKTRSGAAHARDASRN